MDREFLIDLFASFGPVTIRPMFSGFGISADGINFALALRSGLYLRADEVTVAQFEAAGSRPFQYQTRAKTVTVGSYWQVPAHLFDDADEFSEWARAALGAAQRAALQKRSKGRSPRKRAAAKSVALAKSRRAKTASKRSVGKAATTVAKAKSGNKTGDKSDTKRAKKSATTKRPAPRSQSRAKSAVKAR